MTTPGRRFVTCAIAAAILVALPPGLRACPVCFQVEQGPVTDGLRAAVVVLMAVTGSVLTGFAVFIGRFVRRSGGTP